MHFLKRLSGLLLATFLCLAVLPGAGSAQVKVAASKSSASKAPAASQAPMAIAMSEYAARRDALAAQIDSGIVVALGERTPITDFGPFFQIPAFHYLTGFDEADAGFVMVVHKGKGSSTLFLTPINPRTALYYGFRPDSAQALQLYGIPGRSFSVLKWAVDSLVKTGLPVYNLADFGDADFARQDSLTRGGEFIKTLQRENPGLRVINAQTMVNRMRAKKSDTEIALLKRAAEISSEGHRAVLRSPQPKHEYEWRGALEGTFYKMGAERVAYGSIVGSGEKGTQLHYMKDMGPTNPGDLVVMDAAAQYMGYTSDVTRTYPVNGVYSPSQRAFYQIVLDAQKAAEKQIKVGAPTKLSIDSAYAVRARGLAKLGLIDSAHAKYDCSNTQINGCDQANFWMIHGISHGVGLAVHDYVQSAPNDPTYHVGDVFTIEPGIYVSEAMLQTLPDTPNNKAFVAHARAAITKYNNTGVRIEDTYAVTEKGLVQLSNAPKEIADIEAMMRAARGGVVKKP